MKLSVKTAKSGKISIYAEGEFMFTLPADIWYSSHFSEGDEISNEELSELKAKGDSFLCFDSAMRMLSLRAHSEYELKQKLTVKFNKQAAEQAIIKLRDLKLLDDEKFAFMFAEELQRRKNFAPKRIFSELISRGINENIAHDAVNALENDSEIGIIKLMEKLHITEESTEKEKQRAVRRLMNMGYSCHDIFKHIHMGDY